VGGKGYGNSRIRGYNNKNNYNNDYEYDDEGSFRRSGEYVGTDTRIPSYDETVESYFRLLRRDYLSATPFLSLLYPHPYNYYNYNYNNNSINYPFYFSDYFIFKSQITEIDFNKKRNK
jgi:hypothetical protein